MNPLTKVRLINELNEREANLGIKETVSWHSEYSDSAWIFVGGLPFELSEGDTICVFSQYGEIVNINLVRDKKTGKSKGFCFICYEDQRSTILAVDNLNGIKIKGRTIRVDHVKDYRPPKDHEDIDDVTKRIREQGCAPTIVPEEEEEEHIIPLKKSKKDKKEKKKKKKEKKKKKAKEKRSPSSSSSSAPGPSVRVKQEKHDQGYDKYSHKSNEDKRWSQRQNRDEERASKESVDRVKDHHFNKDHEEERWRHKTREETSDKLRNREEGESNKRRETERDRKYEQNEMRRDRYDDKREERLERRDQSREGERKQTEERTERRRGKDDRPRDRDMSKH